MHNRFFGSKLNTVLLVVLIILLGVTIWMIKENKILDPITDETSQYQTLQVETKKEKAVDNISYQTIISPNTSSKAGEYKNEQLGISFSYQPSLGEPITKITNDQVGFYFIISFGENIKIGGTSSGYVSRGRDGFFVDWTQKIIESMCPKANSTEVVYNKDGQKGSYSLNSDDFDTYSTCKDIPDSARNHFIVFDGLKGKVQNVVLVAGPDKVSKNDLLKIFQSASFK